ncbi:MAG: hypothetical protein ACOVS5_15775, partial [Oligoflexus sp.]
WTSTVLSDLYPTLTAVEDAGSSVRAANSSPFYVTASSPPTWRLVCRTSLALSPNWRRSGQIWDHAQELGTLPIPQEFTSVSPS